MQLSALVDYVCTKTQLVGDSDKAAARKFLSTRYELIYDAYLWKDALGAVDIVVDPTTNADNAEGIVLCPEVIDRVVAVRTPDRGVRVRGLEDFYRVDFDRLAQLGPPVEFALLSPIWFVWRPNGLIDPDTNLAVTRLGFSGGPMSGDADTSVKLKAIWTDQTGRRHTFSGTARTSDLAGIMAGTKITVEAVFKDMSSALDLFPNNNTDMNAVAELAIGDTRSPSYQRIRLASIPTTAVTLSVLGKKKFIPLDFDQEEPAIKNLDNCLIAFASGDMLQRMRQFGKAQSQYQEGAMLLKELAKLEVMQAANNNRIIPDGGFGDPFFAPGRTGGCY